MLEANEAETAARTDFTQADWMFERIIRSLKAFEESLSADQEAAVRLMSAPGEVLRLENIGYWNPDLIKFYGITGEGYRYELIQHVSQVSLLLVAVQKAQDEPRRIGFNLVEQFEKRRAAGCAES